MPPRKSAASSATSRPGAESMFYWTAEDGTEIQLPKMSTLGAGLVRRHRKLTDADFLFTVLEAVMTEDELAMLDRLPLSDVNKLFTAWQQDSVTIPQS